ncbi:bZIP transcription factor 44-like [Hibiscus syriacus]|uniref:bZIP transcription factor 44-like n=1 Tax=Hibiscus syriacus TaxID=106335 RepID=UPI00192312C8|nr:bZIP transcription factor 44-like [Hibiscus syriacus]
MASSSGKSISNSSGSSPQQQNSGSDHQRKRRRMESNRESARRSRMRKQKHVDDLVAQITKLKSDNNRIQSSIGFTTQQYMSMEAENSVLRAQMMELSQRLESLNEILDHINNPTACNGVYETEAMEFNPFNLACLNQQHPIMASPDMFQY